MRRILLALLAALFIVSGASAHNPKAWRKMKQDINFFWASDLDRYGCYDQKVVANLMGELAGIIKPECIISTGDTHHGDGVQSVNDDDWQKHFRDIYNHPNLQIEWVPVLGNHEYRGNPQALIDYSKVYPLWNFPNRYYTRVFKKGGVTIRFVMLDTTPMINRYRESEKYPDAAEQDIEAQLQWLDKVLSEAKEDWVIVAGHHPIHTDTKKSKEEREDMREAVNTILLKHSNVSAYICGHVHSFQHLRDKDCDIDYVICSSASLSRDVNRTKRTIYCSPEPGFSVITVSKKRLSIHMIDKNGNLLHTVNKSK